MKGTGHRTEGRGAIVAIKRVQLQRGEECLTKDKEIAITDVRVGL
jgi:hypothetical protein